MALGRETLREWSRPRDWQGLRGDDASILSAWLGGLTAKPDELHTSVPVGRVPRLDGGDEATAVGAGFQASCAWRVDVAARFGPAWWLIECKPAALHYAIGQVLFYRFWWRRMEGYPDIARTVIMSDQAEPDIEPVCREYGIDIINVGDILEFPRSRRSIRAFGEV